MEDQEVIGYLIGWGQHDVVVCTTCHETSQGYKETITWGQACEEEEPPLCVICGCYLPTDREP